MIKANELRIGNLVKDDDLYYEVDITVLLDIDSFEPIDITEEWLLKLGFKKQAKTYWISLYSLKAELHFEVYIKDMVLYLKSDNSNFIFDPIKYIHQLQNLYFALTGEELEINK